MAVRFRILALGGDGIGPEVVASGLRLVEVAAPWGVALEYCWPVLP